MSEDVMVWYISNKQFIPVLKQIIKDCGDDEFFYDEYSILDDEMEKRGLIKATRFDLHFDDGSVADPWYKVTMWAYKLIAIEALIA